MPTGATIAAGLNGLVILSSASLAITLHFDGNYQSRHASAKRNLAEKFAEFSVLVDGGHAVHEDRRQLHDNLLATSIPRLRYFGAILLAVLIATSLLMSIANCDYIFGFDIGNRLLQYIATLAFVVCVTLSITAFFFWSSGQTVRRTESAVEQLENDIYMLKAARSTRGA